MDFLDPNWSFEADPGDTSMDLSGNPPSIQQRILEASTGVDTESRIPDFTAFSLRHHGLPHRLPICIIEIKSQADTARSKILTAGPQIITQAKLAFDCFPDLRNVLSIFALGDSWCLFRFPRDEVARLYLNNVEGWRDNDAFDPARASTRPRDFDISKFIVIPFSKVLDDNESDYSATFKDAIRRITAGLKVCRIHWRSNGDGETVFSELSHCMGIAT